MHKLKKLLQILVVLLQKKHTGNKNRKLLFYGCAIIKQPYLNRLFKDHRCFYFAKNFTPEFLVKNLIKQKKFEHIYAWGKTAPDWLIDYAMQYQVPISFFEDGFIRSCGLGKSYTPPYSLCFDNKTLYFDATTPSQLDEMLLQTTLTNEQIAKARYAMQLINDNHITKYNEITTNKAENLYGPKTKKRILVIGQVENDMSIKFGCNQAITNNDLVRLAAKENPDAQIIYKAHPDVVAKYAKHVSNPNDVKDIAQIITEPMSIDDALLGVDNVYTITSLSGFEALIRGVPVTTIGAPFYAGWGLTDSRQAVPYRNKKLSLETLFYVAYVQYPTYFDPATGEKLDLEKVIEKMIEQKTARQLYPRPCQAI